MEKDSAARFANAREMMDAIGVTETHERAAWSGLSREAMASAPTVAANTSETPALARSSRREAHRTALVAGVLAGAVLLGGVGLYALPWLQSEREIRSAPPPASNEVVVAAEASPAPPPASSEVPVVEPAASDAGRVADIVGPAAPSMTTTEPSRTGTRPLATSVTVECGEYTQQLRVMRASDGMIFGSVDGLGPMPSGVFSTLREAFTAQAAAPLARCLRGHAVRQGQTFELDVDESGHVTRVEVGNFCPVEPAVAACARRAFSAVEIPTDAAFRVRLGADVATRSGVQY